MTGMVIVGAGECGTRAAFALREAGYDGEVTLVGAESGLPYERPPLSKPAPDGLLRRHICQPEELVDAEIDYRPERTAMAIDPVARVVKVADGEPIAFDRLLLATGARPRRLSCTGAERALMLRSHADAHALFSSVGRLTHVVIIGAGLIGMELAASMRVRGAAVSVIEVADRPLRRAVPPPLVHRLLARHEAEGVRFHFNATVEAVYRDGVRLADGTFVAADVVVAAVGIVPRVALARGAGLEIADGIGVDGRLETSRPGIYAAGDCARVDVGGRQVRYENWRNARAQAETVARNMLGESVSYDMPSLFRSDQYGLGLHVVGNVPEGAVPICRRLPSGAELFFYLTDDGTMAAAAGMGQEAAIGKGIQIAALMIERAARPDPAGLADPSRNLRNFVEISAAA